VTGEQKHSLGRLYDELKRRRVIRVATLYVLALWPVIQIIDILAPAIGISGLAMRNLLFTFAAGLPVALTIAWFYDLNREGLVRTGDDGADAGSGRALIGRGAEAAVIAALVLVIGVLFYLQSTMGGGEETPAAADTIGAATRPRSIAVLPFATFSDRPEDERFSDGLTEELLNVLAQISGLRVTARTTSFAYKGVSRNVQEIGRELNVATILEGSVRRGDVGNRIRVTAQLIDVATGSHLWSRTFEREFRNVFQIQDDIAATVVSELDLNLADGESARLAARDTMNPEAVIAFGMGQAAQARRTAQSLRDAQRYFEQAIAADPAYVAAHAELANTFSLQADQRTAERSRLLDLAQAEVDRAMALDERSGSVWAAQGLIHLVRTVDDPAQAEMARETLSRALELNPNLAMASMWYGNLQKDPAERQRFHAKAFELDPRSPVAGYNLANDYLEDGREAEAMSVVSRIVEADPNYPGAYRLIAKVNEGRGRLSEAIANWERVYQLQPSGDIAVWLGLLWVDIGDFDEADRWLQAAVASEMMEEDSSELFWARVASYVARGDNAGAEVMMQALLEDHRDDYPLLLDQAQASYFLGRPERSVEAYEAAVAIAPAGSTHYELHEVELAAAWSYRQLGREVESDELLARVESRLDERAGKQKQLHPDQLFVMAQLHAIRGNNQLALISLQRAIDEGWRQHWRPPVEPSLAALVDDPTFAGMMQGLATRMELIREQIEIDNNFEQGWRT
jgi:TolB-like protein/Tfp pilus assembly protein PilF